MAPNESSLSAKQPSTASTCQFRQGGSRLFVRRVKKTYCVPPYTLVIFFVSVAASILGSCRHTPVQHTAGWKTYTNEKYGYRLLYPPDVRVTYPVQGYAGSVRFMRDSKMCFAVVVGSKNPNARVSFQGKTLLLSSLNLQERIIVALRQVCPPGAGHNYSDDIALIEWNDIKIGRTKGMQAYHSSDPCLSKYLPASVFIINNRSYRFNAHLGSKNEYNRILSTVAFIE